ncbi:MAG: SMI1/KNR4 family protein [Ruminococcus sp.]|nr:SMI1/KNR4 family protein [Ruminococcus sp.]
MPDIVSKMEAIKNLYHLTGCTDQEIEKAQQALGLRFSDEYVKYVKAYGAVSFYATEWTGLNVEGYLNVVEATMQERNLNPDFPDDCYVIENQDLNGSVIVSDSSGSVSVIQEGQRSEICRSLLEYLEICLRRMT